MEYNLQKMSEGWSECNRIKEGYIATSVAEKNVDNNYAHFSRARIKIPQITKYPHPRG